MTLQEIDDFLKKHVSLIFRYKSAYYSLQRRKSLFRPVYRLIATDTGAQERNTLAELCGQVCIGDDTLLIEAIKHMEIPKWDDPSWKTFEAVRHCVIVYGNEIHFQYRDRYYWIAHLPDGQSHLSDDAGNTQIFDSCRDLFKNARIDGDALADIWERVTVDAC